MTRKTGAAVAAVAEAAAAADTPTVVDVAAVEGDPVRPDLRLLLLPLPGFALLPFGAFVDKLRFSADEEDHSRQRYCTWTLLGLDGRAVASSSGVSVVVDIDASANGARDIDVADAASDHPGVDSGAFDYRAFDYLVIFGSRSAEATRSLAASHGRLLRAAVAAGLPLVAIDNASFLLAQAGLLRGYRVALHWRHVAEFRAAFPRIGIEAEAIYCFDRDRITCAGGMAAIDMAVQLLARHCGLERARKGLADMLVDELRPASHHLQSLSGSPDLGRHLSRAVALMRDAMGEPLTVAAIASRIGIGRRHLDRLFVERFGVSAHDHWTAMRMALVHWRLVNSTLSLAAIADEVGLGNAGSLARAFRQHYGCTPTEARAFRVADAGDASPSRAGRPSRPGPAGAPRNAGRRIGKRPARRRRSGHRAG